MFCNNCRTQISDEANFCWKCGKPQKSGVKYEESQEVCEIVWEWHHEARWLDWEWRDRGYFKAIAIGPSGKYIVATSKLFALDGDCCIQSDDPETLAAHNDLVKRLVQDGWEPVESSTVAGFNNKFRRRVR